MHEHRYATEHLVYVAMRMPNWKKCQVNVIEDTTIHKAFQIGKNESVFTFPVTTLNDKIISKIIVVDGFARTKGGRNRNSLYWVIKLKVQCQGQLLWWSSSCRITFKDKRSGQKETSIPVDSYRSYLSYMLKVCGE